jgi:hypothetical protein
LSVKPRSTCDSLAAELLLEGGRLVAEVWRGLGAVEEEAEAEEDEEDQNLTPGASVV